MIDPQLDHDVEQLWSLLFGLVLAGENLLSRMVSAHGLTTPQFYVLKTLTERGGSVAIGQIADAHGLTNATMTGLVKRLELQTPPLVRRAINQHDRRSITVTLTEAGAARYVAVQAALITQIRMVIGVIPADERAAILTQLTRYSGLITASLVGE